MKEWEIKSIGDIFKISSGGTPSRKKSEYFENGSVPWIKTGELKGKFASKPQEYITEEALKNSSAKIFPVKTVLLAMYGATIGACSILDFEAATNQACAALLPNDDCDEVYLFYYLTSIKDEIIRKGVGGAQPNISAGLIKKIKMPLPPLETQKKIAAILDAANAYRQKTKVLIEKYDQLAQSLFLDMFGDPVTNSRRFNSVTIRDLVREVKYGTSSKAIEGGKYPYLRMNNITYSGHMDYSNLKYIDIPEKDIHKYVVRKGDVLFNRTNSKELVGKTGIVQTEREMIIAGYLIRIRVNQLANPYYIWGHLNSKWAKLTLNNMCKNIVGMANINAQELQNIKILEPPISLQNQFAERIKLIEQQKQQARASLQKAEELFNSLLQRAFKGELVKE